MPRPMASRGLPIETSLPSSTIRPELGCSAPARIRISVDFPAPFSPTSTLTHPR